MKKNKDGIALLRIDRAYDVVSYYSADHNAYLFLATIYALSKNKKTSDATLEKLALEYLCTASE